LALCAGLTGIRMAIEGRYDLALGAVVLAAILDGLDGSVARLLKSTSRFGAELDSLTDFVNFGVAPALVLYIWILNEVKSIGWIAALIFAICTALRLARFNVALDGPEKPDWQGNYFVGVPAPAGALAVLLPLYVEQLGLPHFAAAAPVVLVYCLVIAFLTISRLPTWSGKRLTTRVSRDMVLPVFVVVVVFVALLASYPFYVLTIASIVYLATLPVSRWSWNRRIADDARKRQDEDADIVPLSGTRDSRLD
jgi:CDP-diacylglycerol--serine O-phosphatidyltransferase